VKNAVLYFFLLLTAITVHGQDDGADCGMYGKKTIEQRNKLFPFSKAKKILLVSYADYAFRIPPEDDTIVAPPPLGINRYVIREEGFKDRVYNTIEEVDLELSDVQLLSNIVVNFRLKKFKKGLLVAGSLCYEPRNSILFFDENNDIICCLEICFDCWESFMRSDPDNLTQFDDVYGCEGKLELIRELFRKNGIKYGIEKNKNL